MRPITPQPGYTENDVKAIMASGSFVYVDCYTIEILSGQKFYWTSAQKSVIVYPVGGSPMAVDFRSGELLVSGLMFKASIGLDVDEQELVFSYEQDRLLIQGLPMSKALILGRLDGATIHRDRFVGEAWGKWAGGFPLFHGRVSTIDSVSRSKASLKVKSDTVLLDIDMPRDLWQPSCRNTWGDINCGINKNAYAQAGVAGVGSTPSRLIWPAATASFNLGTVHISMLDGVTRVRTIRNVSGTSLLLSYPIDGGSVEGLAFTAYPGCDRTYARCGDYSNTSRFRGYPFVPVAETAA